MRVKYKLYFVVLGFVAQFLFFGSLSPALLQANDVRSKEEIVSPASLPETDRLTLITIFTAVVDGKMVGSWPFTTMIRPKGGLIIWSFATTPATSWPLAGLINSASRERPS